MQQESRNGISDLCRMPIVYSVIKGKVLENSSKTALQRHAEKVEKTQKIRLKLQNCEKAEN